MVSSNSARHDPEAPRQRVIVIEDDDDTREIMSLLLSSAGYRVDEAASGQTALDMMGAMPDPPALAVVDVIMPGISGYDVIRAMRRTPKLARVPVMIISGGPRPEGEDARIEVAAWLDKPSSMSDLLIAVSRIMDAHA